MTTRRFAACAAVVATAILMLPAATAAQSDLSSVAPGPKRVDVSGSGGYLLSTDWGDLVLLGSVSGASGAREQVIARELVIDPGPVFDLLVTYWEGRYGFRVHGGFSHSCLAIGGRCGSLPSLNGAVNTVDVDTWVYDVGGAIGLLEYRRDAWAWPYVFVGVGGVTYDLERSVGPPLTFLERTPDPTPEEQIIVSGASRDELLIVLEEVGLETKLALNIGIGADFMIPVGPTGVGFRVEVSDHIHRSPVGVRVVSVGGFAAAARDVRLDFGFVHNLRAAAGLVLRFGR